MIINEELEIQELANIIQKTSQSIYERLNKPNNILRNYIVPNSQPVKLYKKVISEVYGFNIERLETLEILETLEKQAEPSTCTSTCMNETNKGNVNTEKEFLQYKIKLLENTIEIQKEEIKSKDNTINDLTRLLDQEQQLSLRDKQKLIELEHKAQLLEDGQQKKKWGLFSLFERKVKE